MIIMARKFYILLVLFIIPSCTCKSCYSKGEIIITSQNYNNPPEIKINGKNPYIGEVACRYDSLGNSASSFIKQRRENMQNEVDVFRNDSPDIISQSDNYLISIDYCNDDYTIDVYYSLLLDIDEPSHPLESSWTICIDWNKIFGFNERLELNDQSFSLENFEENVKYIGIRIDFRSPTFGLSNVGFLIQNVNEND